MALKFAFQFAWHRVRASAQTGTVATTSPVALRRYHDIWSRAACPASLYRCRDTQPARTNIRRATQDHAESGDGNHLFRALISHPSSTVFDISQRKFPFPQSFSHVIRSSAHPGRGLVACETLCPFCSACLPVMQHGSGVSCRPAAEPQQPGSASEAIPLRALFVADGASEHHALSSRRLSATYFRMSDV